MLSQGWARPRVRGKLERLARYVSRPPVSVERLALTAQGQVRYRLKTPYRDGNTHIVLEPVDFMARLAALVPPPRKHRTRFHHVALTSARRILAHRRERGAEDAPVSPLGPRAPPGSAPGLLI